LILLHYSSTNYFTANTTPILTARQEVNEKFFFPKLFFTLASLAKGTGAEKACFKV
jgi:hypothetical protein